jgi:GAF domain-containing protein
MRRGAKPAKAKVQDKPPAARKSPKNESSSVGDLEKRLAEAQKRETEALEQIQTRNRELVEAREQQAATAEILRVIASSPTEVRPVFDVIVRAAQRLLGAHSASAFQLTGDLVHRVAATVGGPGPATLYPMPLGQMMAANPAAARVWTQGELWRVTDTESDPYLTPAGRRLAQSSGYRSLLWIPLVRDRDVVGVIAVTRQPPGGFTDAETALL